MGDFDRLVDHLNDIFETTWMEVDDEMKAEMEQVNIVDVARWGFLRGYLQCQATKE